MFGRSTAAVRVLAIAVAMALGLSSVATAFAQDTTAPPEGLVDGAQATYATEDSLSQLIFSVFQFEDEAAAEAGLDAVLEVASASLGDTGAAAEPTELTDVEGLDEIGDRASAYDLEIAEGVNVTYIVILDGVYIHYWAFVGADLDALGLSTPEADAPPDLAATPGAGGDPVDVLVDIASSVLGEGAPEGAALGDLLPTDEDVPAGYTENSRSESLNG
ncbi:MAG TPA: acid shock protein [Thermomicrobiales bacterium]|jgi:hypothetical protein|nr:acid shock protein [Thermomicrobiales bacterium]